MTADPHPHLTEAVLRPVRGHHAFEACVEQLATAIRLGRLPAGQRPAARARAGRAAGGLPSDAARGDGRAARGRPGRDPARPAVVAPWSPSGRGRRRHARPRAPRRSSAGTGSTPSTSAGSSSPAPPHLAASAAPRPRPARRSSRTAHDAVAGARRPGPAPPGRLPLPPDHRRPQRVAPHDRRGHLGAGQPARDAERDPGARHQHQPLRPPAPGTVPGHHRAARPSAPAP